jgi:heme-degrading monooxygenase HmoA
VAGENGEGDLPIKEVTIPMAYAGMVHFSVKSGALDEAAQAWREGVLPAADGQPGYKGAMLLVESAKSTMVGIGLWESKSDADAWATTGPWRAGSELRDRFDGLLSEESTREEFEVAYLHVPASS